jgi:hypothetical protein
MPSPITKIGVKQHMAVTTAPQIPTFKHFLALSDFVIITLRSGLTYTLSPQSGLSDVSTSATIGEFPVDDDRWHALHAQILRPISHRHILHVEDRYITGSASDTVYKIEYLLTCRTPGAKNFDFPSSTHYFLPLVWISLRDSSLVVTSRATQELDNGLRVHYQNTQPATSREFCACGLTNGFSRQCLRSCALHTVEHQHILPVALPAKPEASLSLLKKTQALGLAL